MKKIITSSRIIVFVMALVFPLSVVAELKLVADNWPPFTSDKPGQRIAVDLVEQALKDSGITAQAKIVPWKDVLAGIKRNEYDAIVGAWKSVEREQYLLFSQPYLENRIMLVGRTDNKIKFEDVSQLENKKIGLVEDYAYGEAITNNKKIVKVKSPSVNESLKKLLNKEVDFILTDSIVAQSMKQHLPLDIKKQLAIYDKVVIAKSLYFAIRKTYPDANALLEKFNKAVTTMIANGSYNRILGFEWLLADTDGDGVEEFIIGDKINSKSIDPAKSDSSYTIFSGKKTNTAKPTKYRVLNLQYNSWEDAQQAIQQAESRGSLKLEDREFKPVNIFSMDF